MEFENVSKLDIKNEILIYVLKKESAKSCAWRSCVHTCLRASVCMFLSNHFFYLRFACSKNYGVAIKKK